MRENRSLTLPLSKSQLLQMYKLVSSLFSLPTCLNPPSLIGSSPSKQKAQISPILKKKEKLPVFLFSLIAKNLKSTSY